MKIIEVLNNSLLLTTAITDSSWRKNTACRIIQLPLYVCNICACIYWWQIFIARRYLRVFNTFTHRVANFLILQSRGTNNQKNTYIKKDSLFCFDFFVRQNIFCYCRIQTFQNIVCEN